MNTREQYLQKRVEILEASLRLAYEQMFVAERIIEHVESVANAFAFDLVKFGLDKHTAAGLLRQWDEAQEKARAR